MPGQTKKISLLIFSISNAGGCERITCGLANELSRRNYDVSIINIYNNNFSFFPLDDKVSIQGLYKKSTRPSKYHFPFVPFRLLKLLSKKSERPDVLIGVGIDMSIYALLALRILKIPFIAWEHFNFTVNTNDFLTVLGRKLSARFANYLVVLTNKDKFLFKKNLPIKGEVICIPNFMTFPANTPSALNSKTAIAMGRYTYQKGFDNLIKIWAKVSVQHPDWHLKIIGKGEDKPLLEALIKENKLESAITLVPLSKQVVEYYEQASLFLLSSRWEGLPMVTIEAKSFGLPIISFDCDTGPRDIIENNEDGILVTDQDNDAFVSAVNGLLDNRQRIQNLGKQSLINSKQFTSEVVIPLWEKILTALNRDK